MTLVIDASVAVKWYVEQSGYEAARAIAASNEEVIAPELLLAETGNALWRYVKAALMSAEIAAEAALRLPQRFDLLNPLQPLTPRALQIAIELRHPIYDCFYLALAELEKAPLVTADRRLAAAARALPNVKVQLLNEI